MRPTARAIPNHPSRPARPDNGASRAVRRARAPGTARGFTLVELLVVLTVIGVTAAVAVPRYHASLALYRAQGAARRLAADLDRARSTARATGVGVEVQVDHDAATYALKGVASLGATGATEVVCLGDSPYFARVDKPTWTSLTFTPYGSATESGSVDVRLGSACWRVRVEAASGRVVVERR